MTTIISKRHIVKFYFSIILVTLFFLGIATILLLVYTNHLNKGTLKLKENLIPLFSILFYILAGYCLYRYIKNAPTITLDNNFIKFNNQIFLFTDIEKIELTGKQPFKFVISVPMEAATLTFKNGDTKYIFDDMYSNSWEIKSFLKQVVIDKKDFVEQTDSSIDTSDLDSESYETYKGTVITSLRGIALWGLIGYLLYMLLNSKRPGSAGLAIFFSILWFLLHSRLMNYFQVSNNFFIVRNHNFFWTKRAYRIQDIKEIVFETQGKMPNCLRVITKNFKNKLYPAGTLRDKTWLELKDKLETYKIKVRNECI
jgi:ABC-type multidrug transport system fused ATPase/permease subunit